jgi:hypothetical protein
VATGGRDEYHYRNRGKKIAWTDLSFENEIKIGLIDH